MNQASFFREESAVAARQAKTDPLFLARTVRDASTRGQISEHELAAAHKILIKWADLDKSGQLASKSETQQQGDFLEEIFGKALGYRRMVDNAELWEQIQHPHIEGQTPDAILGHFKPEQPIVPEVVIELKGPLIHLDRDRSHGRIAVDQSMKHRCDKPLHCGIRMNSRLIKLAKAWLSDSVVSIRIHEIHNTSIASSRCVL